MGGVESTVPCNQPLNPDILSVITLSDSAVQRLPLAVDDSPLEKELRNQNIDDFWRDRIDCLEQTFAEANRITEKEFQRLEFALKKLSPGSGKLACPRTVEDTQSCYLTYPGQSLNCTHIVRKMELCLDTTMQESARKRRQEALRRAKKKC